MIPYDLVDLYEDVFKSTLNDDSKADVLKNLLTCIDVRLFGATFAPKTSGDSKNISLHGTCQITPGVNKFTEDVIYTEQILSQLRNPEKGKQNTTIGTQSRLEEGHYVHHFSVNPKNIEEDVERVEGKGLTQEDIDKLKEGLRRGASFYDSSAKAGTENELLLWVQLKEDSRIVLPSFVDLVDVNEDKTIDFKKVDELLSQDHIRDEIEKVEIYYSDVHTKVVNEPEIAEKQQL
jgi:CRISPR-associated protein Csh2